LGKSFDAITFKKIMGLKCGIVGLPNVGKSTLFNALTSSGIQAENFPFCTIDPNIGIVNLPDSRLNKIAEIVDPEEIIQSTVEFVDIAGLVEGASKGEGLGNKFLANIRETDAIIHVVRCFEDESIIHVRDKISPLDDIKTIELELVLADMEVLENSIENVKRKAKSGDKKLLFTLEVYEKTLEFLNKEENLRNINFENKDLAELKGLNLISIKPVIYVANIDDSLEENVFYSSVKEFASENNSQVIGLCNQLEAEIAELGDDKDDLLRDIGLKEPGLNIMIKAAFNSLGLQTFFTAGKKEVRAWEIKKGSLAPQAAGTIHTDFEKGFIRAETISYEDYIEFNGEQGAKEAGKLRSEGSEYIIEDGDIVHFRFNI
jgi:GTP-binding protein YchF